MTPISCTNHMSNILSTLLTIECITFVAYSNEQLDSCLELSASPSVLANLFRSFKLRLQWTEAHNNLRWRNSQHHAFRHNHP